MIIAFNYIRYLHIYPLYFMNAVKGTITRLRVTRTRQQRERTAVISLQPLGVTRSVLFASINIDYSSQVLQNDKYFLSAASQIDGFAVAALPSSLSSVN